MDTDRQKKVLDQQRGVFDRKGVDRQTRIKSYFGKAEFSRILLQIWRRYEGLGKVGGHVSISKPTLAECEAINSFMGKYEKTSSPLKISLLEFEQEMLESVFACSITELHELLVGEPLLTRAEKQLLQDQAWQQLFVDIEQELLEHKSRAHSLVHDLTADDMDVTNRNMNGKDDASLVLFWLSELQRGSVAAGYRMLRELWLQSAEQARSELFIAAHVWQVLLSATDDKHQSVRLPVLAALAVGDPHAVDRNTAAGRLLFQALRFAQAGEPDEAGNEELVLEGVAEHNERSAMDSLRARGIYRAAGVLDDDLSSLVHLFQPNRKEWIEPYVMTLRQIEAATELPAITDLYVVENPAVFSTLVDHMKMEILKVLDFVSCNSAIVRTGDFLDCTNKQSMLVCTSGPASAAALRLLDRFTQASDWCGSLYYSGDFDIKGIEMGNVLATRYPHAFIPWRFDTVSYYEGLTDYCSISMRRLSVFFTDEERLRLKSVHAVWDNKLTGVLFEYSQKLFQEQLIAKLATDWSKAINATASR